MLIIEIVKFIATALKNILTLVKLQHLIAKRCKRLFQTFALFHRKSGKAWVRRRNTEPLVPMVSRLLLATGISMKYLQHIPPDLDSSTGRAEV